MQGNAVKLRDTGKFGRVPRPIPATVRPVNLKQLRQCVAPTGTCLAPFRPRGAGHSATACAESTAGTVIDMTAFDDILNIDAYNDVVVAQAGVRIGKLAEALAEHGLELAGGHDLASHTLGGAIAGACTGPAIADDGALFASRVTAMKVVTPGGRLLEIGEDKQSLLNAFRLSYGMLGVIYEVTLKVRPVNPFAVAHRRCNIRQFAAAADKLSRTDIGVKFHMLPFRDRVYLELRRYGRDVTAAHRVPWKIKDWGETTVLPHVFKSLGRLLPVPAVRYRIIDEISQLSHGLLNNRLVAAGNNAIASPGAFPVDTLRYSTWVFPAADFSVVVQAYRDFCWRIRRATGFRCDMPTVGFRLCRDRSALLSPSFDEPMFALRAVSTQVKGWEDFVIDFAEFAQHWGGMPLFNQSRAVEPAYANEAFGSRVDFFRRMRRRIDPENRMMNPFLSQYFL